MGMSKPTLTTRDSIFDFIVRYKREHDGNSPSTREIAEICCITPSAVRYHLTRLEIDNLIHTTGKPRRNIEIVGGIWQPPEGGHGDGEELVAHDGDDLAKDNTDGDEASREG